MTFEQLYTRAERVGVVAGPVTLASDLVALGIRLGDPNSDRGQARPGLVGRWTSLGSPVVVGLLSGAAVLVVALLGMLVLGYPDPARTPASTADREPVGPRLDAALSVAGVRTDRFNRDGGDGLGTFPKVGPYLEPTGLWALENGRARLTAADPLAPSLATVDLRTADFDAQVSLVDAAPGTGIAFRVIDAKNGWLWVAEPRFGKAALTHVVDGKAETVATSDLTELPPGVTLGVHARGPTVELVVAGEIKARVTDRSRKMGTRVGLGVLAGGKPGEFDDFAVVRG